MPVHISMNRQKTMQKTGESSDATHTSGRSPLRWVLRFAAANTLLAPNMREGVYCRGCPTGRVVPKANGIRTSWRTSSVSLRSSLRARCVRACVSVMRRREQSPRAGEAETIVGDNSK